MTVPYTFGNTPVGSSIPLSRLDDNFAALGNSTNVSFTQNGTGAVIRTAQSKMADLVSVLDFGADPTGSADSTTAIQAALNSGAKDIYIPQGTYLFSTLTVYQNTRVHGASTRTSILKHTGNAVAITCVHTEVPEPDGYPRYIESGWFIFEDIEVLVNGTVGFDVGNTLSSFTNWNRVYIRHLQDGGVYYPGSIAIKCNNTPWLPNDATYLEKLDKVFIRGFETGLYLNDVVNGWELNRVYMIEVKDQIYLSKATGINIIGCYFESGIAAVRGIVFGVDGGNNISIFGTGFEFTNLSATQYVYDFTAGGPWSQITVVGAKYLLQGDGNGVNNKRIIGSAPVSFLELNRSYLSTTFGEIPMLWGPGIDASKPFQLPNTLKAGGFQQGAGTLLLGRNDDDSKNTVVTMNALSQFSITNPDNVMWLIGNSSPEGVVTAAPGSLYTNTAGGAGITLYVKESGTGNTGWVAK